MSAELEPFDLATFRSRLTTLASHGVYLGTSSWKYPGWCGQIYDESRYSYRGKFTKSRFEGDCLREYAETFSTVCVDAAYYTWPSERNLLELRAKVHSGFRFAFKVTDAVTVKRFPNLPRFGLRAGSLNEEFLNAPLFVDRFLGPLEAIRDNVGPLIFEFSKFYPADYAHGSDFVRGLDRFLGGLPKGWEYGVELRNRLWLGGEYLDVLKSHGVAHVFNNWAKMPPVSEQMTIVGDRQVSNLGVARFLLHPGVPYAAAVEKFEPYVKTIQVDVDARQAGALMMHGFMVRKVKGRYYVYINNRLEGNAPNTIAGMMDRLFQLLESFKLEEEKS